MRTVACLALLTALSACSSSDGTAVGVTLEDGQVLVGEVQTDLLELEGAFGTLKVPLSDVGVVLPVEGATLSDANDHVTVWLRNGSELRGKWVDPEVAMGIQVGGKTVSVDLPADEMQALQLRGGEEWPGNDVYRVRTSHGDDFLIDPAQTQLHLTSDLGEFSPFLSECKRVQPLSATRWRVELQTGTILTGDIEAEAIDMALPMGPEVVSVPLTVLTGLERHGWGGNQHRPQSATVANAPSPVPAAIPEEAQTFRRAPAKKKPKARPGLSSSDGWFSNSNYEAVK